VIFLLLVSRLNQQRNKRGAREKEDKRIKEKRNHKLTTRRRGKEDSVSSGTVSSAPSGSYSPPELLLCSQPVVPIKSPLIVMNDCGMPNRMNSIASVIHITFLATKRKEKPTL